MALVISLPPEKKKARGGLIERYRSEGAIPEKDLESSIGKLSFSQTPVVGRMGRATMSTLYEKQNAMTHCKLLTEKDT